MTVDTFLLYETNIIGEILSGTLLFEQSLADRAALKCFLSRRIASLNNRLIHAMIDNNPIFQVTF